jgi:hypothetical protein
VIQHLVPASDCSDDLVRIGDPLEGFAVSIVVVEEAVDGGLKVDDGSEMPRFSRRLLNVAKKPSTALSHEEEVGVKWKVQCG